MNTGSVIKGGLVAGLVLNIGEWLFNAVLVAEQWEAVFSGLGFEQSPVVMVYYILGGFVLGIVAIWLYAAARPRLGPGPMTAVKIGLVLWLLGWLWPFVPFVLGGGVFPAGLMTMAWVWALVEIPLAVMAGAWLYHEDDAPSATPA